MKRRSTSWRWLLFALLAFSVAGCGMARYEDEMDKQRRRVQAFDEVNRALENPIEIPTWQTLDKGEKKDVPAWPPNFDVFLRLPKIYGNVMKDKSVHSKTFPLARYSSSGDSRTNTNAFVVAALVQDGKKSDDPSRLTYTREGFRTQLRVALGLFCSRTHQTDLPASSRITPLSVALLSPYPSDSIEFQFHQYSNVGVGRVTIPYTFEVYVREEAGKQIAIVFQRDAKLENAEAFNSAVKASLGTLDIGAEAAGKRLAFKKR